MGCQKNIPVREAKHFFGVHSIFRMFGRANLSSRWLKSWQKVSGFLANHPQLRGENTAYLTAAYTTIMPLYHPITLPDSTSCGHCYYSLQLFERWLWVPWALKTCRFGGHCSSRKYPNFPNVWLPICAGQIHNFAGPILAEPSFWSVRPKNGIWLTQEYVDHNTRIVNGWLMYNQAWLVHFHNYIVTFQVSYMR